MLSCHLCKAEVACNLKELYSHFRSRHGISDRYSRYSCCQGQCCRTFTDKYTFGRHIERCHKEDIEYVDKSATSATSRADDPEEVMESSTLLFFPHLISAVAESMSAILAHMLWP